MGMVHPGLQHLDMACCSSSHQWCGSLLQCDELSTTIGYKSASGCRVECCCYADKTDGPELLLGLGRVVPLGSGIHLILDIYIGFLLQQYLCPSDCQGPASVHFIHPERCDAIRAISAMLGSCSETFKDSTSPRSAAACTSWGSGAIYEGGSLALGPLTSLSILCKPSSSYGTSSVSCVVGEFLGDSCIGQSARISAVKGMQYALPELPAEYAGMPTSQFNVSSMFAAFPWHFHNPLNNPYGS